jgi:F-type H+-transporting ATPase subunit epsilon
MKPFTLIITAIDAPLYNGEAFSVTLPGEEGNMTVLAHHQALITRLKEGIILVKDASSGEHSFPIDSGVVEIANNKVTVLL